MTEKQLIQGIRKDDRKCFDEIFHLYYDECFAYTMSLLDDPHATKDILQNVFFKIWLYRDRLDASRSLKGYLFTSIRREVISYLRLKCNSAKSEESVADVEARHSDPYSSVLARETDAMLRLAIENLPPQRRKAFELSLQENMTAKDIATQMNLSQRTVEHYIAAAKSEIKKQIS